MRLITLILSIFAAASLSAQELGDTLLARLNGQCYEFPQEKLHLTTDRSHYMGGDTIWLRGFIVSSATHEPVSVSKYMYVELRTPYNTVDQRVKVLERDGVYSGYVPLDLRIAEGDYTLVAYTNFMNSAGEEYFFKKPVNIRTAYGLRLDLSARFEWEGERLVCKIDYKDRTTGEDREREFTYRTINDADWRPSWRKHGTETVKLGREEYLAGNLLVMCDEYAKYIKLPKSRAEYDVTFHPEGGYIVPGEPCRVAFKAIDSYGAGIAVSGRIVSTGGEEVARFKSHHAGMGYFTFTPRPGESYRAECVAQDTICSTFALPQANSQAAVLSADIEGDSLIDIRVKGNVPPGAIVAIQERGLLVYADRLNGRRELSVLAKGLQSGIVQVLLLDGDLNALSERLLFAVGGNAGITSVTPSRPMYSSRDKVTLEIELEGYSDPTGSIAIAVTDDLFGKESSGTNILANLLLQSELAGYIENPAYYFESDDGARRTALDALLMTQGWRRYDIPAALRGEYQYPLAAIEKSQQISGTVKSLWRGKPLEGATVKILSKKLGFARSVKTDSEGRFYFVGFDNVEGVTYDIEATNKKGDTESNMEIDREEFPEVNIPNAIVGFAAYTEVHGSEIKAEQMRLSSSGVYNIFLSELLVERIIPGYENKEMAEILSRRSFDKETIEGRNITSIEEAIRRIAGVTVDAHGYVSYRNRPVMFAVDGVLINTVESNDDKSVLGMRDNVVRRRELKAEAPLSELAEASKKAVERAHKSFITTWSPLKQIEDMYPFSMVERIDFVPPDEAMIYSVQATRGGVIEITTKSGEGVAELNKPGMKSFTPLGYQRPVEFYSPKYARDTKNASDGGDLRSTVYWNPDVEIGADGKVQVSFYANDSRRTRYSVKVEGVTQRGDIIKASTILRKD